MPSANILIAEGVYNTKLVKRVMEIRATNLAEQEVRDLLALHHNEMLAFSPPGTAHVLDLTALQAPDIEVYAAWNGSQLLSIGGLRQHSGFAEVKSMRAHPDSRGNGAGKAMLDHLIERARTSGNSILRLETGTSDLFAAANGLYQSYGFEECPPFAGYPPTEFNRFYEREIG